MPKEPVNRRLAAILAADVVGYSSMMGADEAGTLAALKRHRETVFDPAVAAHNGRVVKLVGDGTLVEFFSVVDAVECALAVQRAIDEEARPNGGGIALRIGINLGDVIVDGDDIYGDGVNIAARLEQLADPGGVCVSSIVNESVGGRIEVAFTDSGEVVVRNIDRPLRVWKWHPGGPPTPEQPGRRAGDPHQQRSEPSSIAVLPFVNMSGDPEQEYFVDGMVEEIITGLSRLKWLLVIARNSSFAYKGRAIDVRQVGRELGVRYVLEGSVRRDGQRVRITAQLIEATSGAHIWAGRYDRAIDDIFALQDELTISTVAAIEPSLRLAEIERARRKRPDSLDAYDLVLRAMPFTDTLMPEGALQALPLLECALALDPDYALAHGQAALCHEILYVRAGRQEENRLAALRHGHAAVTLGPDDAAALTFGGIAIGMVEHDRAMAREAFEEALALCPSAAAYFWGSLILGWGAEAELAIEWGERGIRLSPFDPWITVALHGLFLGHFHRARYEQAATAARRALRSKPGFSISHMFLAAALTKLGRLDEAKLAAERVLSLQPNFSCATQCAAVGAAPLLAAPLIEALRMAGLPK